MFGQLNGKKNGYKKLYLIDYNLGAGGVLDLLFFDTYFDGMYLWETCIGTLNVATDIMRKQLHSPPRAVD